MSLKNFLTGKNLLVSLGLLGVGIVVLKMITGNIPPSRPPASKAMGISGGYYDIGNVAFNDDIPVIGTLGYDWNYDEATGMMPTVAGIEGNISSPSVMNAYYGRSQRVLSY